ncbi:MAG: ribose 5-phosphate isomerase B [Desulfobacterales bacterium]|nr:ribose 5-phosphate isomerase B [Desulfobacterales bacterium]MBS3755815.1 ribose 5-phosphate isomerase B [Desulfobacterales bacterium]
MSPVVLGCDHAGYELKETIKGYLDTLGCEVADFGTHSEASVDYPDFGSRVARSIDKGEYDRAILICGTGLGMSMVANRFAGVRGALCNDLFSAIMSRRHNDANILIMGGRVIGSELAREIVRTWLETPFEGGRHHQRLEKFCAF